MKPAAAFTPASTDDERSALRRALTRVRLWVEACRQETVAQGYEAKGCDQTLAELDEAIDGAPGGRATHRSLMTGQPYRLIGRGLTADTAQDVVIIEGLGSTIWVVDANVFDDGRFERLQ